MASWGSIRTRWYLDVPFVILQKPHPVTAGSFLSSTEWLIYLEEEKEIEIVVKKITMVLQQGEEGGSIGS